YGQRDRDLEEVAARYLQISSLLCGGLRQQARDARPHVVGDVGALERIVDHGDDVTGAIPDVVAPPLDLQARQAEAFAQRRETVGQLDLAALPRLRLGEDREDLRRQKVAADDRHPRR